MLDLERRTKLDVLSGDFYNAKLSASLLRTILHTFLVRSYPDCTLHEVGALFQLELVSELRALIIEAFRASMPEPREDAGGTDPGRPPQTWPEMWSEARYDLRLTDEEWLDMTPRMVRALNDRRLEEIHWIELMFGQVSADIRNHSFVRSRPPAKATDFLLHRYNIQQYMDGGDGLLNSDGYMSGDQIVAILHGIPGVEFVKGVPN